MIFWKRKKEKKEDRSEKYRKQYYGIGVFKVPELKFVNGWDFIKMIKNSEAKEYLDGSLLKNKTFHLIFNPHTFSFTSYVEMLGCRKYAFKGDKTFFAYKFMPFSSSNSLIFERLYFYALDKTFPTKSDVLTFFNNGRDFMVISPSSEWEIMKYLSFLSQNTLDMYGYQYYLDQIKSSVEELDREYRQVLQGKGFKEVSVYGPYGFLIRGWVPENKEAVEYLLKKGSDELIKKTMEKFSPIAEEFGYYGLIPGVSSAYTEVNMHYFISAGLPRELLKKFKRIPEKYFPIKDGIIYTYKKYLKLHPEDSEIFELTVGEEAITLVSWAAKMRSFLTPKDIKPHADIYLSDGSIDLKTFLKLFKGGFVATGRLEKGEEPVIAGFYARQKFGVASVPGPAKYVIRKMGKDGDEVKVQELYDYPTDKILIARYPVAVWFRLDPPELSEIFVHGREGVWRKYLENCESNLYLLSSKDEALKDFLKRACLHKKIYTTLLGPEAYRNFLEVVDKWLPPDVTQMEELLKFGRYRNLISSVEYVGFFGVLGDDFPKGKKYYLISEDPNKSLIGTLPRRIAQTTGISNLVEEFLKINPQFKPDYKGPSDYSVGEWPFKRTLVLYFDGWPFESKDVRYTGIATINAGGLIDAPVLLKDITIGRQYKLPTGLKIVEIGVLYNPWVLDK